MGSGEGVNEPVYMRITFSTYSRSHSPADALAPHAGRLPFLRYATSSSGFAAPSRYASSGVRPASAAAVPRSSSSPTFGVVSRKRRRPASPCRRVPGARRAAPPTGARDAWICCESVEGEQSRRRQVIPERIRHRVHRFIVLIACPLLAHSAASLPSLAAATRSYSRLRASRLAICSGSDAPSGTCSIGET